MVLLKEEMIPFYTNQQADICVCLMGLITILTIAICLLIIDNKHIPVVFCAAIAAICLVIVLSITYERDQYHQIQIATSKPQQLCQLLENYNLIKQDGVVYTLYSKQIYAKDENINYVDLSESQYILNDNETSNDIK